MKTLNTVLLSTIMMLLTSLSFAGASCSISGPVNLKLGDVVTYYYNDNGGASYITWYVDPAYARITGTNSNWNNYVTFEVIKTGTFQINSTGYGTGNNSHFKCATSKYVTASCDIPSQYSEFTTTCTGGKLKFYVKYPKSGYTYNWLYEYTPNKYKNFGSGTTAQTIPIYTGYMLSVVSDTCVSIREVGAIFCNDNYDDRRGGNRGINGEETESVFPNPSSGNTFIRFNASSENKYGIKVVDLTGKLVKVIAEEANYSDGSNTIKIADSNLSRGFYIVSVFENGRMMKSHKFIRE